MTSLDLHKLQYSRATRMDIHVRAIRAIFLNVKDTYYKDVPLQSHVYTPQSLKVPISESSTNSSLSRDTKWRHRLCPLLLSKHHCTILEQSHQRAWAANRIAKEPSRGIFFLSALSVLAPWRLPLSKPAARKKIVRDYPTRSATAFHDSVHAVTRGRVMNPAAWKLAAGWGPRSVPAARYTFAASASYVALRRVNSISTLYHLRC